MENAILNVLNDESLNTVELKLEAMKKALALEVIPKDKYNELSNKLKDFETEKGNLINQNNALQSKYDELRTKNMSADEKAKEELEQLRQDKELVARQLSEIAVERVLTQNGINADTYGEEDYKAILNDLISDNAESSKTKATNFVNILTKQKEFVEKQTTSNLLKNTPEPNTGSSNDGVVTKDDFNKMTYSQMMNFMKESPELYQEYSK